MAVIINELEVVVEPPAEQRLPEEGRPGRPQHPSLNPEDLSDILERQVRQQMRVIAH